MSLVRVNLGGEGEVPGVINQQPPFALRPSWKSQKGKTVAELRADGHLMIICDNTNLAFADGSVDEVFTNNIPVDTNHPFYGPGVQSSEIRRILTSGGIWTWDRKVHYVKP